jgi:hypothetical protein
MMDRRRGKKIDRVDSSFMWDLNRGLFLKIFRKPVIDPACLKTKTRCASPHVFFDFPELKL